ncbi:MAG: hypothetical protein NTW86_24345 [Candidatus Sumerlaeota bacterium]|nr:hypothetical protein [Candidatus Sumerlaeota bacterium]
MKNAMASKLKTAAKDDLRPEYRFDYQKAKPNRFHGRPMKGVLVVLLDEDITKVFRTPEEVKTALRAVISAMPKKATRGTKSKE